MAKLCAYVVSRVHELLVVCMQLSVCVHGGKFVVIAI